MGECWNEVASSEVGSLRFQTKFLFLLKPGSVGGTIYVWLSDNVVFCFLMQIANKTAALVWDTSVSHFHSPASGH